MCVLGGWQGGDMMNLQGRVCPCEVVWSEFGTVCVVCLTLRASSNIISVSPQIFLYFPVMT